MLVVRVAWVEADIGPLTWVSSDITIVGTDECMFFNETEALTFEMTIDGSTLTLMDTDTSLTLSTDNYFDTADEVTVTGSAGEFEFRSLCRHARRCDAARTR